jgi:hypothetical protein
LLSYTFPSSLLLILFPNLKVSSVFSQLFHESSPYFSLLNKVPFSFHLEIPSNIPEKSGRITKTVGKSVNLFTISSICLVTQPIRNPGKAAILFCFICTISLKSPSSASPAKSIQTSTLPSSPPHHPFKLKSGSVGRLFGEFGLLPEPLLAVCLKASVRLVLSEEETTPFFLKP